MCPADPGALGHKEYVRYADRVDAGRRLADALAAYGGRDDVTVLGLVRGGVPVAAEVARRWGLPLDVLVIRKLGLPWAPEVAFGAVGPDGVTVHNPAVEARLSAEEATRIATAERAELTRREARYRSGRAALSLTGRVALVVDDGLATGASARAAVAVARRLGAATVVLAVPVGSPSAVRDLAADTDEVVCPLVPADFGSVGSFYESFPQTDDAEVLAALAG